MLVIIFYRIVMSCLLFLCTSCSQSVMQDFSKTKWRHLDERALNNATLVALERWHTDSLGCLNLRTRKDSDVLISTFGLDSSSGDSVITVLGKPNHIHSGKYSTMEGEFIAGTKYSYFFHTLCDGDSLLPESFVSLIISSETGRVFRRAGGTN